LISIHETKEGNMQNKIVAILATDGFEEAELFEPKKALEEAGATVKIISLKTGKIKAWKDGDWSKTISVDELVTAAHGNEFDALMLPGGVINTDKIRSDAEAVKFTRAFVDAKKPVFAICHAAWTLVETGSLKGRTLTSWPSLKTDLKNAGATWVDQEVVVDQNWVSSRKPDDLPAFNKKIIEILSASAGTNASKDAQAPTGNQPGLRYSASEMTADGLNIPKAYGNLKE
jgi:protease I